MIEPYNAMNFVCGMLIFLSSGSLLVISGYATYLIGQFKSDYLNPADVSKKVNLCIPGEIAALAVLLFSNLLMQYYMTSVIVIIIIAFYVYFYINKEHELDPTSDFHGRKLDSLIAKWQIKCFIFLMFFIYATIIMVTQSMLPAFLGMKAKTNKLKMR